MQSCPTILYLDTQLLALLLILGCLRRSILLADLLLMPDT
jgi:hypothetical protein